MSPQVVTEPEKIEWRFSLVLEGADVNADDVVDRVFEACDSDVSLGIVGGTPMAQATRAGDTFSEAVLSVISDIEESGTGLRVTEVEPDDFVSIDEIASRTGRTYESVRLLTIGGRGPGDFPEPVAVVGRTSLWTWSDVSAWFSNSGYEIRETHNVDRDAVQTINAALTLRSGLGNSRPEERKPLIAMATRYRQAV